MVSKLLKIGNFSAALLAALTLTACTGDTNGNGSAKDNFAGTQFVATDGSTGSISLVVGETTLPVASVSGFTVYVKDAHGAPVSGMTIACDSEAGVAIIEPTMGMEITNSHGLISGKIGCKFPGSFQFGCRLPVGANKRKLVQIKCTGDVPAGFDGFPGSAGGGLGTGGVDISHGGGGAGGFDTNAIRITDIAARVVTDSTTDTQQIDIIQDTCSAGPPAVYEKFGDDFVKITVVNNTNSIVRFTSLSYDVPGAGSGGGSYISKPISLLCEVPANGGSETCTTVFTEAASGGVSNKRFYGAATTIAFTGFKNITFRLTGIAEVTGEDVTITSRQSFGFNDYAHCS